MSPAPADSGPRPAPLLRALPWLLLAIFLTAAGRRDFWYPDEPDMADITNAMARSGDWLQLRLAGEEFPDYPPLYFWMTAALSRLAGRSELVLRLVSLASALASLGLLAAWARRRLDPLTARWLPAVLGTLFLFAWNATNMHIDPTFAAFIAAAVVTGDLARDASGRTRAGWLGACGLAMGLAALVKGPAGLVLPGGILVLDALLHREFRRLTGLAAAGLLGSAVFLAWAAAFGRAAGEDQLFYFLFRQNFERFTEGWSHLRPWHYYLLNIWSDLLPWSLLLPAGLAAAWTRARAGDRGAALLLVWALLLFAFFSVSRSKRGVYLLPAMPAFAGLVACEVRRLREGLSQGLARRALLWGSVVLLALLGVLGVVALFLDTRALHGLSLPRAPLVALGLAGLGGALWTGTALRSGRLPAVPVRLLSCGLALWAVLLTWLLPALDDPLSAKADARWLLAQPGGPESAVTFYENAGVMPKEASAFGFYADRPVAVLDTLDEVALHLSRPGALLLVEEDEYEDRLSDGPLTLEVKRRMILGSDVYLAVGRPAG